MLSELMADADSEPFREPIDLHERPDYLDKVVTPMDLSLIRDQLASGFYEEPKDLNQDLKLMFQNIPLYFTDKKSDVFNMTTRLQKLANDKIKSILNNYKQEQIQPTKKVSGEKPSKLAGQSQVQTRSQALMMTETPPIADQEATQTILAEKLSQPQESTQHQSEETGSDDQLNVSDQLLEEARACTTSQPTVEVNDSYNLMHSGLLSPSTIEEFKYCRMEVMKANNRRVYSNGNLVFQTD